MYPAGERQWGPGYIPVCPPLRWLPSLMCACPVPTAAPMRGCSRHRGDPSYPPTLMMLLAGWVLHQGFLAKTLEYPGVPQANRLLRGLSGLAHVVPASAFRHNLLLGAARVCLRQHHCNCYWPQAASFHTCQGVFPVFQFPLFSLSVLGCVGFCYRSFSCRHHSCS